MKKSTGTKTGAPYIAGVPVHLRRNQNNMTFNIIISDILKMSIH
jgi:hypothetical protein